MSIDVKNGLKRAGNRAQAWCRRHRARALIMGAVGLVLGVVAFGLGFGLGVATFVVVVYTAVFTAISIFGWRPLEARPSLEVGLWQDGKLTDSYLRSSHDRCGPIDVDECVRHALQSVRAEVPAPPRPPSVLSPFIGSGLASTAAAFGSMKEDRHEAVARLKKELTAYEAAIRKWLEAYDSRRWPTYSKVEAKVAIRNGGDTVARGITLRIKLPNGTLPLDREALDALEIEPPPAAPRYEERSRYAMHDLALPRYTPSFPDFSATAVRAATAAAGPTYVLEEGHAVAEVRLDTLTHGVTERSARNLAVLPGRPGVYELSWEAHVGNLRQPARGVIHVKVDELPKQDSPLDTVDAVVKSGEVRLKHD